MSNALHDLGDVFHRFGEEIKGLANKVEGALKRDEKPAEHVAEHVAEEAAKAAGEAAVKAAESAASDTAGA